MWKNGDNRTYDRVYLSASPVTSSDHVIWRKRKYELSIEWRRMHAIFGHLRNKCWTSISCLFINQLNVQFILIYTLELWHSSMCAFHAYIVRSCFHFDAHMYVHGRYEQVNMNAIPPLHTYMYTKPPWTCWTSRNCVQAYTFSWMRWRKSLMNDRNTCMCIAYASWLCCTIAHRTVSCEN